MKFKCIERDIQAYLDQFIQLEVKESLSEMPMCAYFKGADEQAILTALRVNHVNMTQFLKVALWEWEHIVTKMIEMLPTYVQENLKDYDNRDIEERF